MSLLSESRALAPVLLRDHWRRGSKERPGRLLFGGVLLLLGLILAFVVAAIGELPDERLRRNLLNLLGLLGVVGWLAAAIGARIEMSRQFDVRRLRVLPVRFGTLCTLRVGAGLSGFWIVVIGPALLHLLAARTAGLVSAVVALLAILALVVLLGRLTALVLLGLDDAAASWLVTATLLILALAALLAVEPVVRDRVLDLSDRSVVDGFADRIRESRALSAAGYLPGGLLAAIFEAPRDVGANLVRLAALWLAAGGCMLIEARTLRRSRPVPAAATGGFAAGCLLPLARILRRTRGLEPSTGLALIEFESWMRTAWVRGLLLVAVPLALTMQTGRLLSVMLGFAVGGFLAGFRYNAFGTAHRSIADRFLLPVRPIDLATASGKGLTLLPACVACLVIGWAWQRVGWPGPAAFTLWLVLPVCVLVGGLGFGAYSSVRWPYPVDVGFFSLNVPSAPGGFLALLCFVALAAGPPFLLEDLLAVDAAWGPPAAALGGVVLMLCAVAVGILLVRAADRVAQADPHRILGLLAGHRTEDRPFGRAG